MVMMLKGSTLLLLVVACAIFAQASASSLVTQNLIEWIRSRKGGIYNDKQEEKTFAVDGKNLRGVFATQDIAKGEVLLEVPWDSILGTQGLTKEIMEAEYARKQQDIENEDDRSFITECRLIRKVYSEAEKGEASEFAPHLKYLLPLLGDTSSEPLLPMIPAAWSEEGRDLLDDIHDHGLLPPYLLFGPLNHDQYGICIKDIENNPLEKQVAAVVASHGCTGSILQEYGILVPLIDNYYYTLKEDFEESNEVNAEVVLEYGAYVRLEATQDIPKGGEIVRPMSFQFDESEFSEGEMLRNWGLVETHEYPKFHLFETGQDTEAYLSFGVQVDKDPDDGSIDIEMTIFQDEIEDEYAIERYCAQELHRIQRLKNLVGSSLPETSTMSQAEWDTAWDYHFNLVEVLEGVLRKVEELNGEEDVLCPGGLEANEARQCPIWDGFPYLPDDFTIAQLGLTFDEDNPYGPSDHSYSVCNDDYVAEFFGYQPAGDLEMVKSQYQEIRFFTHLDTKDMVMKLDGTVQQTSAYRPHYHEFAVHFPARFVDTIKRVLFVGGGDSMVLHEVLKYPSLEKVVGLELDQYVLRNSFRYFNTQPHFDDKRVEWWFGDGAKSLLMLPKDYFQSFDLVVVDLSETVMSFQVTSQLSIFQTLSLLLKPEGILLKNGEYYMDKMSAYFDYTLQYFEYDIPFICDQGMVIGSNKVDFFNSTMKDHGVELLVLESQDEINEKFDKFYRFTEYRKNDARKQGQCMDMNEEDDGEGKNAGILMVVEAENVKHDLKSLEAVEKTIADAIKTVGFSIESTVKHEPSTFVIVMKEGYVTARLNPEESYVGLDIKLWANFDLMELARDALVQSLGGTEEGTSSFRIVTGGMIGSPLLDKSKIGPRMVNNRNCEPAPTPSNDKVVDLKKSGLEGSMGMVEDGIVAAVICGTEDEECKSLDILNDAPETKFQKVVPVYTCESMRSSGAIFSQNLAEKMTACELELSEALGSAGDKISLLVVDDSANKVMGKALLSLFTSIWKRKKLFAQHRFAAVVDSTNDGWHRNLLVLIRENIFFKPMSLVDLVVENASEKSNLNILSLYDPKFFLHLKETVEAFNEAHGGAAIMEVENVFDGMIPPQTGHFNPKKFKADAYDPVPAQEQLAGQTALGRQAMVQFEITSKKKILTASQIESSLTDSFEKNLRDELEFTSFEGNASIGDGIVTVVFSSDGAFHAILSWDGKAHIDLNLYSADVNPKLAEAFFGRFLTSFSTKGIPLKLTLSDSHPRGIGRVISFPGHMN